MVRGRAAARRDDGNMVGKREEGEGGVYARQEDDGIRRWDADSVVRR